MRVQLLRTAIGRIGFILGLLSGKETFGLTWYLCIAGWLAMCTIDLGPIFRGSR